MASVPWLTVFATASLSAATEMIPSAAPGMVVMHTTTARSYCHDDYISGEEMRSYYGVKAIVQGHTQLYLYEPDGAKQSEATLEVALLTPFKRAMESVLTDTDHGAIFLHRRELRVNSPHQRTLEVEWETDTQNGGGLQTHLHRNHEKLEHTFAEKVGIENINWLKGINIGLYTHLVVTYYGAGSSELPRGPTVEQRFGVRENTLGFYGRPCAQTTTYVTTTDMPWCLPWWIWTLKVFVFVPLCCLPFAMLTYVFSQRTRGKIPLVKMEQFADEEMRPLKSATSSMRSSMSEIYQDPQPDQRRSFQRPPDLGASTSVLVDFQDDQGDLHSVRFEYQPLGVGFVKVIPVRVAFFNFNSYARALGVQEGWQIARVAGLDVRNYQSYQDVHRLLFSHLDQLKLWPFIVTFRTATRETRTIAFEKGPLGLIFSSKSPITVEGFKPISYGKKMGVEKGWILLRIGDMDITSDDTFSKIEGNIIAGLKHLPEYDP